MERFSLVQLWLWSISCLSPIQRPTLPRSSASMKLPPQKIFQACFKSGELEKAILLTSYQSLLIQWPTWWEIWRKIRLAAPLNRLLTPYLLLARSWVHLSLRTSLYLETDFLPKLSGLQWPLEFNNAKRSSVQVTMRQLTLSTHLTEKWASNVSGK